MKSGPGVPGVPESQDFWLLMYSTHCLPKNLCPRPPRPPFPHCFVGRESLLKPAPSQGCPRGLYVREWVYVFISF